MTFAKIFRVAVTINSVDKVGLDDSEPCETLSDW
jgi:hypothetical protein